jgi:hypothetical protein
LAAHTDVGDDTHSHLAIGEVGNRYCPRDGRLASRNRRRMAPIVGDDQKASYHGYRSSDASSRHGKIHGATCMPNTSQVNISHPRALSFPVGLRKESDTHAETQEIGLDNHRRECLWVASAVTRVTVNKAQAELVVQRSGDAVSESRQFAADFLSLALAKTGGSACRNPCRGPLPTARLVSPCPAFLRTVARERHFSHLFVTLILVIHSRSFLVPDHDPCSSIFRPHAIVDMTDSTMPAHRQLSR